MHTSSGKKVFLYFHDRLPSAFDAAEAYHGSTSASTCVCRSALSVDVFCVTSCSTGRWIETVRDATGGRSFLVLERGLYTFAEWLEDPGRLFLEKRSALRKVPRIDASADIFDPSVGLQILRAIVDLHGQGRSIGDLTPDKILWFPAGHRWRLLDVYRPAIQASHPAKAPSGIGSKYAAPERVLSELLHEQRSAPDDTASDMWSFGTMILDVLLSGESLYRPDTDPDVDSCVTLSRSIALRLANVPGEHAYTLLSNLLQIHPIKRCTASQALQSAFFRSADRLCIKSVLQNDVRHLVPSLL